MTNIDEKTNENFIMLPTVDFCFKELMKNPKVRKGFIAAVLGKEPGMIRQTTLIPTELHRESEDDKLGILDVLVELEDGSKMNMEMQVPYFEFWANRILFYSLFTFRRIKTAVIKSRFVIQRAESSIPI